MRKQDEILREIAKKQNIPVGKAEEIWYLFGKFIKETIKEDKRTEDGYINPDKCPTLHIAKFGKFAPVVNKIIYKNKRRKKRLEDERSEGN